jgi:hypothetical protein
MTHALTGPGFTKRRARRSQQPQSFYRVAVIVAFFVVLLASEWVLTHDHVFHAVSLPPEPFFEAGLIQLAPDEQGRCARLRLDNRTGSITPNGIARCDDVITAPPPPATEAHRRLHAIRRHFKPR